VSHARIVGRYQNRPSRPHHGKCPLPATDEHRAGERDDRGHVDGARLLPRRDARERPGEPKDAGDQEVIGDRDHRRGGNRCGDELQEGDPGVGRLPQQPGEEGRRHHSDDAAVETPPFAYPAKEVLQRVDTDVVVAVLQRLLGDGADDERQPNRAEQRVVGDEADRVREVPGRAVGDQPARGHDRDEPEEQREQSGARTRTAARGQLRRLCRRPACGRAGGRRARARAGRRPRLAPVVTISTVDYRRRRPHRRSPSRSRAVRDAESSAVRRSAGWSMSWGTCGRTGTHAPATRPRGTAPNQRAGYARHGK
jgi:hypothetical protein